MIEFDGRMVDESVYLRCKQRAERLARRVQGELYDALRENTLPGSKGPSYRTWERKQELVRLYRSQIERGERIQFAQT
jgi:hypothetical protein